MCCWTHNVVTAETVAEDDRVRCTCPAACYYSPCQRRATQEDLLCDVCSGRIADIAVNVESEEILRPVVEYWTERHVLDGGD